MPSTDWLNEREARAWRGYIRMRDLLDLQIGRDLGRDAGLSAADYPVLVTLSESEGHRMRLIATEAVIKHLTDLVHPASARRTSRGSG